MMAIGFSMSNVVHMEPSLEEKAIFFELKNIRYKIIFDDKGKVDQMFKLITEVIKDRPKSKPDKDLPDFYNRA